MSLRSNIKIDSYSLALDTAKVKKMFEILDSSCLEKTAFVLSAPLATGEHLIVRKIENHLFVLLNGMCVEAIKPYTNLQNVLQYLKKELAHILFVNSVSYQAYPFEYPLHCSLRHLPEEGMYGILLPSVE